jgi:DNA-binding GntR family transcriptional regulator
MPVREALRTLEAEGLVSFTPRIGARVADVSEEDLEEIYLVRAALEGLAARLAVERQTPDDVARLREALAQMRAAQEAGDLLGLMRWDREFHVRQYGASGRPRLVKRILDLWDAGRRAYLLLPRTPELVGWRTPSHAAILAACERSDPLEAERLTRAHTDEALARLRQGLRSARAPVSGPAGRRPR